MPAHIALIALDIPLAEPFDYLAGPLTNADIGCRVLVPFGRGHRTGVLIGFRSDSALMAEQLKPTDDKLDEVPILHQETIELLQFASQYYQQPVGQMLFAALPNLLRKPRKPNLPRRRKAVTLPAAAPPLPLTTEQEAAYTDIMSRLGRFQPFLLHGITGSGKTEVYLHLIEQVMARQGQVLMLVPEIRLTPQLSARLTERFPQHRIAISHSDISAARRMHDWLAAGRGDAAIVLGTRLAVFTPMPRLQLIIVDEEHDASFQQQDGLRYSARDLAVFRGRQRQCPVILGSATPALESWFNARNGKYQLLQMRQRAHVDAQLPQVNLIDLRGQSLRNDISPLLIAAIRKNLQRGEQSLLFINRRGYAPTLYCADCGWIAGCSRCSSKLVLHKAAHELRCHHCGLTRPLPSVCPDCASHALNPAGAGTQRLESTLEQLFPDAHILRIDSDTAGSPRQWQRMRDAILTGEANLLIGTQLLSKGHDFPNLTLVGVVGADNALYSTDFRANERLFSQLIQVGGRAGRAGQPGQVLIQTAWPQHPLFQAISQHDYASYAEQMLSEREMAGFPPYQFMVAIRAEAEQLELALQFLQRIRNLAPADAEITVFDPVAESMLRKSNRERALLLAQAKSRAQLHAWLSTWLTKLSGIHDRNVRWKIDVDPQQL